MQFDLFAILIQNVTHLVLKVYHIITVKDFAL